MAEEERPIIIDQITIPTAIIDQITIPTAYTPVPFPYGNEGKRKVLAEHNKEWVLLNYPLGNHGWEEYFFTKLRIDSKDSQYFYSQTINENGELRETQMQYHYVGGILVPKKEGGLVHQFETDSEIVSDFFISR